MDGYPFDLGAYGRPASTASPAAQAWFDRGLLWSYGFNHEEAVRCFERAVADDPGFALAHWGIAYAAGPNYNKAWDAFDAVDLRASLRLAHEARHTRARARGGRGTGRARPDRGARRALPGGRAAGRLRGLEDRLRGRDASGVHARHPDDLDVAALYADALMNLTAVAAVGGRDRRAGGGRPDARDPARARARRWRCRADDAPGRAAPLHPPDGDVAAPRAGARRGGRAARRSSPTPATCSTCRRTSTCCAATTRSVVAGNTAAIAADDRLRRARRRRRLLPRSTARTTTTSGSTGRCSLGQQQVALEAVRRARGDADRGAAAHRGPADGGLAGGLRRRCGCTCSCASAAGTS